MILKGLRCFTFICTFLLAGISVGQNVGIGTNTPDANAVLELNSNNQGILVPRLTSTQRTSMNPSLSMTQKGLMVFDNDSVKFFYWNGNAWQTFGSGPMGPIGPVGPAGAAGAAGAPGTTGLQGVTGPTGLPGVTCLTLQQAYDGCSGSGSGRSIVISGTNAVNISDANSGSIGLKSLHTADGVAISAETNYASAQYATIQAFTNSTYGAINSATPPASAIIGNSDGLAYGVSGQIRAAGTGEAGVFGNNARTTGGMGVRGMGYNGVVGETNQVGGQGVFGANWNSTDTLGHGVSGMGFYGVVGQSLNPANGWGVYSNNDCGVVANFIVGGAVSASVKNWIMDNPLDPENKLLKHICIESPEALNLYRGNASLDANGEAVVELPAYFTLINKDFSYELTAVGAPAPNLYIKEKISDNKFVIAGGPASGEVSWAVYGARNDKYIQAHPELVDPEPMKTGRYAGKYIHPELYGQPKEKSYLYMPALKSVTGNNGTSFVQPILK